MNEPINNDRPGNGRIRRERSQTYRNTYFQPHEGITVYTIQPIEVWSALLEHGILYVDDRYLTEDVFRLAYDWMKSQMKRRLPNYQGHSPWWAYADEMPRVTDARFNYAGKGPRCVRLQIVLPHGEYVLSSMLGWSFVLDRDYYYWEEYRKAVENQSEVDNSKLVFDNRENNLNTIFGTSVEGTLTLEECSANARAKQIVDSWDRIFDLFEANDGIINDTVQATFEKLELRHVKQVTEFMC